MCLSVLKHASAECATNTFSSKTNYEKLAVVVHVLQTTHNLVISRCCFADDGKEMYQELQRTCTAIVLLMKPFVWWPSRCRRRQGLLKLPIIAMPSFPRSFVFKMFCVHTKTQSRRIQIPSGLNNVVENLRFSDGLVWMVNQAVEIKPHFQIYPAYCGR